MYKCVNNCLEKLIVILVVFIFINTYISSVNVSAAKLIDVEERQNKGDILKIYEEIKTPYDFGVIFTSNPEENKYDSYLVDTPVIFADEGMWYMSYLAHDGLGYSTGLAKSKDLVNWERVKVILERTKESESDTEVFDSVNAGGYIVLDHNWGQAPVPLKYNGKYVMTYVASNEEEYERGRFVSMIAFSENIEGPWEKHPVPILKPGEFNYEGDKIWKTQILRHDEKYYIYYNTGGGPEVSCMAVSENLLDWEKYEGNPILKVEFNSHDYGYSFFGNPQVVNILDTWVMFFFTDAWDEGVLNSFAVSKDMFNWTNGYTMLTETNEDWKSKCAHKPMVFKHNDTVFHFYSGVDNSGERRIGFSTNREDFNENYKEITALSSTRKDENNVKGIILFVSLSAITVIVIFLIYNVRRRT